MSSLSDYKEKTHLLKEAKIQGKVDRHTKLMMRDKRSAPAQWARVAATHGSASTASDTSTRRVVASNAVASPDFPAASTGHPAAIVLLLLSWEIKLARVLLLLLLLAAINVQPVMELLADVPLLKAWMVWPVVSCRCLWSWWFSLIRSRSTVSSEHLARGSNSQDSNVQLIKFSIIFMEIYTTLN